MRHTTTWFSVASAVITSAVVLPTVTAKACTSTQLTQLTSVAATYSSSPDCVGSALDSSTNSVTVICAGACMELVRELQPDTPDCEYEGTNLGESMERLRSWCDAASVSGSGSASASSLSSASGDSDSTAINTTDIVSVCTAEDVTFINDLNMEVSKNADCLGSAGAATEATSKAAYCAEDACVAYMTNVEARLPNCSYSGYNIKQVVADALAVCRDNTVTWPPNATTPTATTATLLPTTTTQTPTAAPSADSQTTDTPAVTTSAAVALKSNAHIVMLTLAVVLAWVGL